MTLRLYSSHDVAHASGATYRQIDYWTRTRRLHCAVEAAGSGSQRKYDAIEVLIAALYFRVPLGASLDELAAEVRNNPAAEMVHVQWGKDEAIGLYVDLTYLRRQLTIDGRPLFPDSVAVAS